MFFPENVIFLNYASSAAALVSTCLVCVHNLTPREKRERPEFEIFKILGKNTIFNEHPVHGQHGVQSHDMNWRASGHSASASVVNYFLFPSKLFRGMTTLLLIKLNR